MPSALTWRQATCVPVGLDTLEMEQDVLSPVSGLTACMMENMYISHFSEEL